MSQILGKDRDVSDTINTAKSIINSAGFKLEETNLINPVEGIWSVHLKDSESQFYTNGKGATKESALASAYCEFIERLGSGFFFDDYCIDAAYPKDSWAFSPDEVKVQDRESYRSELLNRELWDFYDPENSLEFEHLIDSGRCDQKSIISYPLKNAGEVVNFPIEIIKNIYASNGLSAGNTEDEALVQGISECIERGVKNYIIREGLSLPTIPDSYLKEHGFLKIKQDIEEFGFPVIIKDASLGGRFPVICALLINQEDGTLLSSFGCHPNPHVAIERTLTELLQGRKLENIVGLSKIVYNIEEAADDSNIESHFINSSGVFYVDILKDIESDTLLWEFNGDRHSELEFLNSILKNEGYKNYYRTFDLGGIWVTQTVIPGLSEIYPVEDLEWDNRNRAGDFKALLKSKTIDKNRAIKALDYLDLGHIPGSDSYMSYIGVSIDDEHSLFDLTIDEVEILHLLILNREEELRDLVINRLDLDSIGSSRIGFWKCLRDHYLGLSGIDFKLLYGKESFDRVINFLDGEIPRDLFPVLGDDFSYIKKHSEVLDVYKKYRGLRS